MAKRIEKSEQEWRQSLSDDAFAVCRLAGTERAFTGKYWDHKGVGTYHCACCDTPLFTSETKYDSGSGWPSFFLPVAEGVITERTDQSHGMTRTEVLCSVCDAHLGHVFPDGPPPTGLRYCINSVSLKFHDNGQE
jgi:peptide-methionine (R)-S-oxide reductase